MADMMKIATGPGEMAWIVRPPDCCGNGHPFRPGDVTTYGEGGYGCWCDAAKQANPGGRPWHNTFHCKACGDVVVVPPCTDPDCAVGWAASHAH